ncbi:twin-arginine translocase TatA/TatE family subunit [Flavobacterium branchiophilum]|uniref:Sec-independent protein translocase TatA n=2 Tax=Flavobacterium branchiophilum TaxID=55197 RepID=A0A2H3KDP6_9FLAO|nr:twin-arginine translocase TatA/TatE family subunit [Flavobacterium branchiophilum]PDS24778.1 Sec-independent protein translocase TatA [Flavobacterium branchiophilum]CCB69036.1 Putative Sec-independent protein translocase (twin-arginine translocation protein) [Flavobacterium branchiophilum FL-15]
MLDVSGGEILFILIVVLMLFGSDKVPEIARKVGKFMAHLKNATNEIKHEIQKGVDDITEETSLKEISKEINNAKENLVADSTNTINKVSEDLKEITGPIKRQF